MSARPRQPGRAEGNQATLHVDSVVKAFCSDPSRCAGLESWQIEQIAEALVYHLRVDLHQETVELGQFLEALSLLTALVASQPVFAEGRRVRRVDLLALAQAGGCGFELGFFRSMDGLLGDLHRRQVRLVQFVNLRACVKQLLGVRVWGRSCQRLHDEIIGFIRSHMQRGAGSASVAFAVS